MQSAHCGCGSAIEFEIYGLLSQRRRRRRRRRRRSSSRIRLLTAASASLVAMPSVVVTLCDGDSGPDVTKSRSPV